MSLRSPGSAHAQDSSSNRGHESSAHKPSTEKLDSRSTDRRPEDPTSVTNAERIENRPEPVALGRPSTLASPSLESKPPRPFDVNNILNPAQAESTAQTSRRRSAAHMDSPPKSTAAQQYSAESSRTLSANVLGARITPPSGDSRLGIQNPAQRKILTPRSPGLRTLSLGRQSIGTINAQQSPFLSSGGSRIYIAEPGQTSNAEVPPIPTPSTLSRFPGPAWGFPQRAPSPANGSRRASLGTLQAAQSRSASPSTSYSSFSQPSRASPVPQHRAASIAHPAGMQHHPASGPSTPGPQSGGQLPQFVHTNTSLAPSSYQLLTLDTAQGPIQVPVDVQAASKMADDKRKRNAGASARFRQRRKEKEREASHTIGKLEQRIRDVTEERDFYRQERDHYRHALAASQGQSKIDQRPPSPRHQPQESGEQWHGQAQAPADPMERNTRRKTDSYVARTSYALQPQSSPIGHSGAPAGYPGPPQLSPRPDLASRSVSGGSVPPSPSTMGPRPEGFEPYPGSRYERPWYPGPDR